MWLVTVYQPHWAMADAGRTAFTAVALTAATISPACRHYSRIVLALGACAVALTIIGSVAFWGG